MHSVKEKIHSLRGCTVYIYISFFRSLSSDEYCKKMQGAQNLTEAMEYFKEVKKRSQGKILEKINAAAPYNFFLTSVTDSKQTHSEPLSLQMFGN